MITLIFIFITGIVASFVGSVAAGSGIIAISALFFLGIPPQIALGTSNFADIGSKIGNIFRFAKHNNLGVLKKDVFILTCISVPATAVGSLIIVSLDSNIISKLIGIVLVILLPIMFAKRDFGVIPNRSIGKRRIISHVAYFFSQTWSGFFSPGSGFIDLYVRTRGYGFTILQGKAVTRIPLLLSSITSVVIFALSGFIHYQHAIAMFLGMLIGGYVGTAFAIKKGDAWLKPLLGIILLGTAVKLLLF